MNVKRTTKRTPESDVPYNPKSKTATLNYWKGATAHRGVAELRAKRGRPAKPPEERKEQIELLPASQTPSLGVMMKPEVANGNETDVQSGVQA